MGFGCSVGFGVRGLLGRWCAVRIVVICTSSEADVHGRSVRWVQIEQQLMRASDVGDAFVCIVDALSH
jgi:hypothetical protein